MAKKGEGRGYEVAFIKSPPKEVQSECPICHSVLFQPKMATCQCGHSFCSSCISRIEKERKPCPLCGEKFKLVENKWLQRTLNGYAVYCPHKDKGCEWTGELGQLDKHLNHSRSTAADDELMKGCQFQVIQCELCQSHYCERRLMVDHVSNECDIQCEYRFAGCGFKGPQQQLSAHNKDSVDVHLFLVTDFLKKRLSQNYDRIQEVDVDAKKAKQDSKDKLQQVRRELNDKKQDFTDHEKRMRQEVNDIRRESKNSRKSMIYMATGGIILLLIVAGVSLLYSNSLRDEIEIDIASLREQHQHTHLLESKQQYECNTSIRKVNELAETTNCSVCGCCCPLSKLELIEAELESLREQIDYPSLPVHLRLTHFKQLKESTSRWLSVPFYACTSKPGYGYLMRLVVYPNGTGIANGTHTSVYLHLMNGKYDRNLSWPFSDIVKVVLNNYNNSQQVSKTFNFSEAVDVGSRVHDGIMALEGVGYSKFISHSMISEDNEVMFEIGYADPNMTCTSQLQSLQGEEISGFVGFVVIIVICCCLFSNTKR